MTEEFIIAGDGQVRRGYLMASNSGICLHLEASAESQDLAKKGIKSIYLHFKGNENFY